MIQMMRQSTFRGDVWKWLLVSVMLTAGCGGSQDVAGNSTPAAAPAVAQGEATVTEPISAEDANAIAQEAFVYFYPLVTMDVTRRVSTNVPEGAKPGFGPAGMFHHLREYPSVEFREVVRPNFDTLYSLVWFDVGPEPMIFSLPDTAGRYYVAPVYDMWTDAFAAIGTRTSGTKAGNYALVGRGWTGTLPAGVQRIEMPTRLGWIIIRTQTNGPKDYEAVHKVQDGYRLTPLSQYGKAPQKPAFTADSTVDMKTPPLQQVNTMPGSKFFPYAAELMKDNPPHLTDWSILARLRRIGIVPGQSFDFAKAPAVVQRALEAAPKAGLSAMQAKIPTMARVTNGWVMNTDTMGVYGNYYLKRAVITLVGLGANSAEDAAYPLIAVDSDGKPPNGANNYVMHFTKENLPPVAAFWSITMYDAQGFQVANPINRYAIGDRDPLKYNADGSLDIYIQRQSPGADKESNWLPAASGPLGITMRLYAPRPEVLDGRWNPPPLTRVK